VSAFKKELIDFQALADFLLGFFGALQKNVAARLNFQAPPPSNLANGDSLSRSPSSLPGRIFRFPQAGTRCPVDSPDPPGIFLGVDIVLKIEFPGYFGTPHKNSAEPLNLLTLPASKTANGDSPFIVLHLIPWMDIPVPLTGARCPVDSPDPLGNFFVRASTKDRGQSCPIPPQGRQY